MKLKTMLADDEPLARERLRFLLSEDEEFVIAAECRSGKQVVDTLKEERFDVLFLDIQMPGGDGFEIIQEVGVANMPATVFVTAHNHYAVQAFEVHALDYLTKPVERERLKATLARVKERIALEAARLTQEQMQFALRALREENGERREYPARLVVPSGTREAFVNVDEIEWVEAADYYACLHVGAKSLMLRETIKQLAETLDPRKFVRVHRSAIVNIAYVREILREGRNEGWVFLSNGQRVKMSKTGWQNLLSLSRS
jgi:two-component system, LytTR family, response regulator